MTRLSISHWMPQFRNGAGGPWVDAFHQPQPPLRGLTQEEAERYCRTSILGEHGLRIVKRTVTEEVVREYEPEDPA